MGRLVEYVITVGIKKPKIDSTQSPDLLCRFPIKDHKDFPLPPDIVFFCQPEGCSSALRKMSLRQTNTFVFTLTDKETSITRYGICCNFYRPCFGIPQERHHEIGLARSYSMDRDNAEEYLGSIKNKRGLKHLMRSESSPLNSNEGYLSKSTRTSSNSMLCFSLTSICIVSSYPFFSTFRECLFVFRKLIESQSWTKDDNTFKKEKKIFYDGNQNTGQVALQECRSWAIFLNNSDLLPGVVKTNLSEIDEWVCNLLKIPLPVAGVNRVEVELLPRHIQPPLTFALPEKSRFSFLDYPIHLPLELLGVETCLKILTCILLEHKVVLQSCDYNALSISVMALTNMLYPLQYMFPIIPLLPTCMKNAEHLLLAPTPYIIGVPSSFFRIKGASFQVPHDVLIVDLDTNKMSVPLSMDEIPPLPEPEGQQLKAQLNNCLSCLSFTPLPVNGVESTEDGNQAELLDRNNINMIYGNDIESVDIAVRAALVKFFCSPNILGNFLQYTRILRLYPRPVVAFLKQSFLNSFKEKSLFLESLVETQSVQYYAEWMVNPDNTVYRKVQNTILDPRIIGDKPRWYSHYMQPMYYQVHNPQSNLGSDLYEDSDTDSEDRDYPVIIEEQNECEQDDVVEFCSSCSSFDESDADNGVTAKRCPHGSNLINETIFDMYDTSYSTDMSEMESKGYHQNVIANSVFSKPAFRSEVSTNADDKLTITDTTTDNNGVSLGVTSPTKEQLNVDLPESTPLAEKTSTVKKLGAIISVVKPKLQRRLSNESLCSQVSVSSVIPPHSPIISSEHASKYKASNAVNQKIYRSISYTNMSRHVFSDLSIYTTENQQLITEVVAYVKSGDGIGWLTTKRLRKLVIDEGLRMYLMDQINIEQVSKELVLNDVHISRNVYRGYLELLKLVIEGYEYSLKHKRANSLRSLFPFLNVVSRYYCGKKYVDDSTKTTGTTVRKVSKERPEATIKVETSLDQASDCSLHYHRDLFVDSSLTYTSLERKTDNINVNESNTKVLGPLYPTKIKEGIYLVVKSNCSSGKRFYHGYLTTSVFEPAGRGVTGTGRRYLFEGIMRNRSWIWDDMELWEQSFMDSVSSERENTGMDVNPVELIARYNTLNAKEKRLLEEDEDILLGIVLHNMIACMVCTSVPKQKIKTKVRSLLAKAHIGLNQTQWINNLLDSLENVEGNDIDIIVPRSQQLKVQVFVVHFGDSQSGPVFFLEVREDCIVLKSTNGSSIVDRWWYENLVNLSCSPRTKVLCIWIRLGEETDLHKIFTKKCKLLYNSIKESMKKAAVRLNKEGPDVNLGGDFNVIDTYSDQHGILKVSLEGLSIVFIDKKITIDLKHLKNCSAKQKVLLVEEFVPPTQTAIEHRFYAEEANDICYAILCLFSYIAAAQNNMTSAPTSRNSVCE